MTKLAEAILDRRVQSPSYFSGRLLAASDLAAERDAHLARQRMLGRAIGAGIVEGLWVAPAPTGTAEGPAVTVSKGVAIDLDGQLLSLGEDQTLAITETYTEDRDAPAPTCLFRACDPPSMETAPSGDGFYLLVMGATARFEETAPMQALQTAKAGGGCGRKWAVPGVQFRLQPFNPLTVPGSSEATLAELTALLTAGSGAVVRSRLRNLTAHLCFGGDAPAAFATDPWAVEDGAPRLATYGVADHLRGLDLLQACELPLAVVRLTGSGLDFVDCWAVRRRPVPAGLSADWPSLTGHRLRAEHEARLLQFQDHAAALLAAEAAPSDITALGRFRFLPAAGLLPLATATRAGFMAEVFFDGLPTRAPIEYINGEQLRPLLDLSWQYKPIDLLEPEMVWLYRPWQQEAALEAGVTDRAYLLFASAHVPPMNLPRFDVARWDCSNYPHRGCADSTGV
jgi:hypothetical protein